MGLLKLSYCIGKGEDKLDCLGRGEDNFDYLGRREDKLDCSGRADDNLDCLGRGEDKLDYLGRGEDKLDFLGIVKHSTCAAEDIKPLMTSCFNRNDGIFSCGNLPMLEYLYLYFLSYGELILEVTRQSLHSKLSSSSSVYYLSFTIHFKQPNHLAKS